MIRISETLSLSIPELEKDNSIDFKTLFVEYGINGVKPRFQLMVEGYTVPLDTTNITVKLSYSTILLIDTTGFISSITMNNNMATIKGYLLPDVELLYGCAPTVYETTNDAISKLYSGKIGNFPKMSGLNLCQCNQNNWEYLCSILRSLDPSANFMFDLFGGVNPIPLTGLSPNVDLTADEHQGKINIKDRRIGVIIQPEAIIEQTVESINDEYCISLGDQIFFSDEEHMRLDSNYDQTRIFLKPKNQFNIEYQDPRLFNVGDVVKLKLSETVTQNVFVISTSFVINIGGILMNSLVVDYDS
jgi:hypothetical protein